VPRRHNLNFGSRAFRVSVQPRLEHSTHPLFVTAKHSAAIRRNSNAHWFQSAFISDPATNALILQKLALYR